MRFVRLAAVFCFLLTAFAAIAQARVSFVHDRTFTVPGVDSIKKAVFRTSHQGDSLSALVSDGKSLVLYSATTDSSLFLIKVDSSSSLLAIEYGDVNRDSVPDLAALRVSSDLPNPVYYSRYWVDVYNPALAFKKDSMLLDTFPPLGPMGYCSAPTDGPFLRALDLNNDGYNELVVSHESPGGVDYGYGLWLGWTAGETYVFHIAPESLAQSWPIHLTDAFDLGTISGVHSLAAYSWSIACGAGTGTDHSYVTQELRVLTDSGVTTRLVPLVSSYERCWEFDANFGSVGNFGPGSFAQALLASTRTSVQTDCYFNPTVPIVSSALELRALITPDSTTLLWSRDITGTNYTNFMYHPGLPGVFFGFSGDTLLMFSGSDGSIRDRLTDVPTGTRYWDFPYNDSIPRLVVINGATVSLYHLDIATGVDEGNQDGSIPASFTLGNPYPNPFNPSTTIKFSLPKRGEVTVAIYNILGQPVRALMQGILSAGEHSIVWGGTNDAGHEVSSGVYFLRASTTESTQTRKLMLLK